VLRQLSRYGSYWGLIMDWINNITIDDIPSEKMQNIAFKNGIADAVSLMSHLPGIRLYIPAYGKKKADHEYVQTHFNGKNLLSVAIHLKLDTNRIKYLKKAAGCYSKPELSNNYIQLVAEKCGHDVASRLICNFFGEYIYIPLQGYSLVMNKSIVKEFTGNNTTELALKYHVTERYINRAMAKYRSSCQTEQLDLFN
jgi:Mor family transcriptional regulator